MTTKAYYFENSEALNEILERIANKYPCFINREFIEMDYSKVEINARNEDWGSIERELAPLA